MLFLLNGDAYGQSVWWVAMGVATAAAALSLPVCALY